MSFSPIKAGGIKARGPADVSNRVALAQEIKETMIMEGFDGAQMVVQRALARDIAWLTPNGTKHFDPATFVLTLGGLLLTAFLEGFAEEAKDAAGQKGREAFRKLEEKVNILFTDKEPVLENDQEQLAQQAPIIARSADQKDLLLYASRSENGLRIYLETKLPKEKSAELATVIRDAAVGYILEG